ncbi:shikimate dehydrogenase family protein [Basilea psittacipulmonis]|uniref:Shikimate dehydrogenase n=1 Tax=Basilea psittacipulmonis DSM 24701 TaxID=1072685 RepID=A0A077DFM8_9BURK|nr:hypothetical protein [Basilea psittacipulmonis]AIL31973.1 shikimate dehydrogenase [Basilea psittacipulmonis DSM 24701]
MNITGNTRVIGHIGYPTHTFKSPMIYNPYFEQMGIDVVVVPFSVTTEYYANFLRSLFNCGNTVGALITMPHKVSTTSLVSRLSKTAQIAGSCNAVRLGKDGQLEGDMFDGEGFVQGMLRKGVNPHGKSALVVGCGGVGRAIAASLAKAGVARIALFDIADSSMMFLASQIQRYYPEVDVLTGIRNPQGYEIVVNATSLGMEEGDELPMDVALIDNDAFVGDVVLRAEMTAFLSQAKEKGCQVQVGTDMLFEQIPVYLEYFGLPTTTPDVLRRYAKI